MANSCAIIILAAGESSRLGQPKQLLPFRDSTLLNYVIDEACRSQANPRLLVLGAFAEQVKNSLDNSSIKVIENREWQEGLSSSIRCGIRELIQMEPACESVILSVADQPYFSSAIVDTLISFHQNNNKGIVASHYANTVGPPTLFDKKFFPDLLALKGDLGARSVLGRYANEVATIPFEPGVIDIDTPDDLRKISG